MKAGLYLHIPFCKIKCAYCDFYSICADPLLVEQLLNALENEIELYADDPIFAKTEFQSIYLGGGTPSLLSTKQLEKLFQKIQATFRFIGNFELTIEANPETLSLEKLKDFFSIGINRLSIGVQSFSSAELSRLGRIHNADQSKMCIDWADRAGFKNINIDLIFAIPGQSVSDWQENLSQAIQFKPNHLSLYGLTIEPGTPLAQQISTGKIKKVTEDIEREMYLSSIDVLSQAGYLQYEISNFAKPGFECKHNLKYWNGSPYLGVGPSAHSFWNNHRRWNVDSVDDYIKSIKADVKPVAGYETLNDSQQLLEFLYLNLRMTLGIDLRQLEDRFQISFKHQFARLLKKLDSHRGTRLYHLDEKRFALAPAGFVLFDEICQLFVNEI